MIVRAWIPRDASAVGRTIAATRTATAVETTTTTATARLFFNSIQGSIVRHDNDNDDCIVAITPVVVQRWRRRLLPLCHYDHGGNVVNDEKNQRVCLAVTAATSGIRNQNSEADVTDFGSCNATRKAVTASSLSCHSTASWSSSSSSSSLSPSSLWPRTSSFSSSTLLFSPMTTRCHHRGHSAVKTTTATRTISGSGSAGTTCVLPILDLALSDDKVGAALHQACTTVGFFHVVNHDVSRPLCRAVLEQAHEFFAQPVAMKNRIAMRQQQLQTDQTATSNDVSFYRGYQSVGENITQGRADLHEALDLFTESRRGMIPGVPSNHGRNLWPSTEMRHILHDLYVPSMNQLGARLMRACALGLGLDRADYFDEHFQDPFWNMRLIYYPPMMPTTTCKHSSTHNVDTIDHLGVGEHTDYGIFTMILAEPVPNTLQVRNQLTNEWVYIDILPDAFTCNVADMLSRWTNGLYRSTAHRVLPPQPPHSGRISVPYFYDPSYDAIIAPIPELIQRSPAQKMLGRQPPAPVWEPIKYGDYLWQKTSSNFIFHNAIGDST